MYGYILVKKGKKKERSCNFSQFSCPQCSYLSETVLKCTTHLCSFFFFVFSAGGIRTPLGEAEHNRCLRSKRKAEPFESPITHQKKKLHFCVASSFLFLVQGGFEPHSAKPNTIGCSRSERYFLFASV